MQSLPHELGFLFFQGSQCGLTSCTRNNAHYHCRVCGFGTSQVGNAMTHGRICAPIDVGQKDFTSLPACSEGSMYSQSTQPYPFYSQGSQPSVTNSKMLPSQQGMYNFVLPAQTPQYGGLYGPQTVFPNSNLFSPSGFNNFVQLDSSWMQQGRILPTTMMPMNSPTSEGRTADSPSCCRRDNQPSGNTPPPATACKAGTKENYQYNPLNVLNPQKYPDSTASSCSISLLFLDQSKENEEYINVDDICFSPKKKVQIRSSCMQADKKVESSCGSSEESDIVVEESDSESSENGDEVGFKCFVCELPPSINRFTPLDEKYPLTTSSQTSVLNKLANILDQKGLAKSAICGRCLELINLVDSLELKLTSTINELRQIFKTGKESTNAKENRDITHEHCVCPICVKSFSSPLHLAKHKQRHSKSYSFCCEYCGKGFSDILKLEKHVQLHSKTLRFQCELCGKQFLEKHTLTNHIRQHKGEYRYHCDICKKGYVQKSVYKTHMESHGGKFHICHNCGKKVKTYSNLMVHIKICTGDLKHECKKCDKKFPLQSLLEKHVSFEHKLTFKFKCDKCSKGFWKESDLKSHEISHSKEKPYACFTCGNSYKSKKNLNHHMKLHEKGLNCSVCNKKFTRMDALSDHMNLHSGRMPYQCSLCWKRFANRINFNVHVKTHEGKVNGTECPVCKKTVKKNMSEHMQTHSQTKLFSCSQCSAVFSFKNSMVKHMKSKHTVFVVNKES